MFDTTQSSRVKGMCASHKVKVARENKRGMKTLSNQGSQHSSNLMLSQYHRTTQPFGSPQTKQRSEFLREPKSKFKSGNVAYWTENQVRTNVI
jgi:hypothetical protein